MNKSRAMVGRQARAFAECGTCVLVPDLFGTGDSSGTLDEVSWSDWKRDISYLVAWAKEQGFRHVTLWGHRLGCLLAADFTSSNPKVIDQLFFWQPVYSGKQHMTQFLRLRMVAALSSGESESVAELRDRLSRGESLEIAGYFLTEKLYSEIETVNMAGLMPPAATRVRILEVVTEAQKPVLPVTAKLVGQWQQAAIDCQATTAVGNPFWMMQDLVFSHDILEKSSAQLTASNAVAKQGVPASDSIKDRDPLPAKSKAGAQSIVFDCEGEQLAGVINHAGGDSSTGMLIVVGGPQYRVGCHRQFFHLANRISACGIPVLRFDYRGLGDSSGELRGFRHISPDIRSAIDTLQREAPAVTDIVIWGLCDAASAAMFYASSDERVKGLILANPFVYSEEGAARALLKHYYVSRLTERSFWKKVYSGNYDLSASAVSAWNMCKRVLSRKRAGKKTVASNEIEREAQSTLESEEIPGQSTDLVALFAQSLEDFSGNVAFILSGKDLTAAEFSDSTRRNRQLKRLMKRRNVSQFSLPESDHTFSRSTWRKKMEALSLDIIKQDFAR